MKSAAQYFLGKIFLATIVFNKWRLHRIETSTSVNLQCKIVSQCYLSRMNRSLANVATKRLKELNVTCSPGFQCDKTKYTQYPTSLLVYSITFEDSPQ